MRTVPGATKNTSTAIGEGHTCHRRRLRVAADASAVPTPAWGARPIVSGTRTSRAAGPGARRCRRFGSVPAHRQELPTLLVAGPAGVVADLPDW